MQQKVINRGVYNSNKSAFDSVFIRVLLVDNFAARKNPLPLPARAMGGGLCLLLLGVSGDGGSRCFDLLLCG